MPPRIEYTPGQAFPNTKLNFLEDLPSIGARRRARFTCSCGETIDADISWVKSLNTTSCGCHRSQVVTAKNTRHSHAIRESQSGAYRSWAAMHQRVKSDPHYVGITVCHRWFVFENFYEDMGDRPDDQTIERVDNTLGYYPGNCVWATRAVQAQNTVNTKNITINGETHSINEWCRIKGIGYHVVKQRRARGMSVEDAITTPINTTKQGRKQNG